MLMRDDVLIALLVLEKLGAPWLRSPILPGDRSFWYTYIVRFGV